LSPAIGRQSCRQLLAGKFTHCFQFFESSNDRSRPCIEWDGVHTQYIHQNGSGGTNMCGLWQEEGSPFTEKDRVYGSELVCVCWVSSAALRAAEGSRNFLYYCYYLANSKFKSTFITPSDPLSYVRSVSAFTDGM
jgi:hypothetical protein